MANVKLEIVGPKRFFFSVSSDVTASKSAFLQVILNFELV